MKLSRTGEETGKHAAVTSGYGTKNNIFIGASHNSTRILLLQQKQARPLLKAAVWRVMCRKVLARWLPKNQPTHFYQGSPSKQNDLSRILYCRHLPAPKVLGCLSTHVLHICPSTARADSIEAQNGFNTNPVNLSVTQHKLNRP